MSLSTAIPRKIWTREETHLLADLGFPNASKLELIDGELIDSMGKSHLHVLWQHLILAWLYADFEQEHVRFGSPIDVVDEDNARSEPEPDLVVAARSIRDYKANPSPHEVRLLIEVSDSTLNFDLQQKARLYARAAIADFWVIDIPHNQVHVHRDPSGDNYQRILTYGFDEEISPLAKPEALFCMARL